MTDAREDAPQTRAEEGQKCDRIEALRECLTMIESGSFPVDISARNMGLECAEGLPIIKAMYSAFSGSLDAAKSLHEALLPDEGWEIYWTAKYPNLMGPRKRYHAKVGWGTIQDGSSDVASRAWLIAILKAIIAEGDT